MPKAYEPVILADTSSLTFPERLEYHKLGIMADELPTVYMNNRMEKTEYDSVLGLFIEKMSRKSKDELDNMVADRISTKDKYEPTEPEMFLFGANRRPVITPGEEYNLTAAYSYTLKRVIARYLSCRLGVPIYSLSLILQHPHYPYMLAKPDFIALFPDPETAELTRTVNVVCKTATHWKFDELKSQMPVEHELRCRHEMAVTNIDETIVVYLCDNNEGGVVLYRLSRDDTMETKIIQCAKSFWENHVEAENLPLPTVPTDAAERDIALYALSRREYQRPPEILERGMPELTSQYIACKTDLDKRKKAYEGKKAELKNIEFQLSPHMLSRADATCGDVKMRWKQSKSRSVDYDGLAIAYPDIYNRFVREKITPGFEVKLKKSAQKNSSKEAA